MILNHFVRWASSWSLELMVPFPLFIPAHYSFPTHLFDFLRISETIKCQQLWGEGMFQQLCRTYFMQEYWTEENEVYKGHILKQDKGDSEERFFNTLT